MFTQMKKTNIVDNILSGIKSIRYPTFYRQEDSFPILLDNRSDLEKLRDDYKVSVLGIKKEVERFEHSQIRKYRN